MVHVFPFSWGPQIKSEMNLPLLICDGFCILPYYTQTYIQDTNVAC